MTVHGATAAATLFEIKQLGFTHIIAIPDSESAALCDAADSDPDLFYMSPCREGESVAIAAGLWTGGMKPLLIIQNTGLMEAGDAIRGCGIGPSIPLRMLVGWRGYAGAQARRLPQDSAYPFTEPILDAWGIPYAHLMSDDDLPALADMDALAASSSKPTAVISGWKFR